MLDLLTSILGGGITGLFGTLISAGTEWFGAKQRHAQEVELRRLDLEMIRAEAEAGARTAAIEAEAERDTAAWSALEASYREARARWSRGDSGWLVFVDVVRGLTRPGLTFLFVGLVGAVYFTLGGSDMETLDLRPRVIETVLYLATTCVLWWFGARQLAKRAGRQGQR